MRKKSMKMLFVLMALFGFNMAVRADDSEESLCSLDDQVLLGNMASRVEITYDVVELETQYVVDVKILNLDSNMTVVAQGSHTDTIVLSELDKDENGVITLRKSRLDYIDKIMFTIVANNKCAGRKLKQVTITVPKFNYNYQLSKCAGIEEFYVCQPLVTYNLDEVDVDAEIEKYKKKLEEQDNKKALADSEKKNGLASTLNKNKYLIASIVVIAGIVATVIVIKKRGSVVK